MRKKRARVAGKAPRPPLAITGAIASSDRLVKDDETVSVWIKIARQIMAVEMESAGIYKATHERGVPFLAIRGISNVVGFDRDLDWTAYACQSAAAFNHAYAAPWLHRGACRRCARGPRSRDRDRQDRDRSVSPRATWPAPGPGSSGAARSRQG